MLQIRIVMQELFLNFKPDVDLRLNNESRGGRLMVLFIICYKKVVVRFLLSLFNINIFARSARYNDFILLILDLVTNRDYLNTV